MLHTHNPGLKVMNNFLFTGSIFEMIRNICFGFVSIEKFIHYSNILAESWVTAVDVYSSTGHVGITGFRYKL